MGVFLAGCRRFLQPCWGGESGHRCRDRRHAQRPDQGGLCRSRARARSPADFGSLYGSDAAQFKAMDRLLEIFEASGKNSHIRLSTAGLVARSQLIAKGVVMTELQSVT